MLSDVCVPGVVMLNAPLALALPGDSRGIQGDSRRLQEDSRGLQGTPGGLQDDSRRSPGGLLEDSRGTPGGLQDESRRTPGGQVHHQGDSRGTPGGQYTTRGRHSASLQPSLSSGGLRVSSCVQGCSEQSDASMESCEYSFKGDPEHFVYLFLEAHRTNCTYYIYSIYKVVYLGSVSMFPLSFLGFCPTSRGCFFSSRSG